MCTVKTAIQRLGGPSQVASDYGFTVQQVCNWQLRDIPARVILDCPNFSDALAAVGYQRQAKQQDAA